MNKIRIILSILLLLLIIGCNNDSKENKSNIYDSDIVYTDQSEDANLENDYDIFEDNVTPDYTNPLIKNDDFFTGSHWNDPHVLYVKDQFVMYASSSSECD